jgi:hypothetical protein
MWQRPRGEHPVVAQLGSGLLEEVIRVKPRSLLPTDIRKPFQLCLDLVNCHLSLCICIGH